MNSPITFLVLSIGTFALSAVGAYFYGNLAARLDFLTVPNPSNHDRRAKPRGGGIIIAATFIGAILILFLLGQIDTPIFVALTLGGGIMAIAGFIDDNLFHIKPRHRFILHGIMSSFILVCFGGFPPLQVGNIYIDLGLAGDILAVLGLMWLINLYNFMDGSDGIAASGAVFFGVSVTALLALQVGRIELAVLPALVAASSTGFLVFNWPPAKQFMGDSGSTFLGFIFGALIIMTMKSGVLSLWTWIIIMGCFIADTTTTLILRFLLVKNWNTTHFSHAYQNLARVGKDHRKVANGIIAIDIFWLLPIAYWSLVSPDIAPYLVLFALSPLVAVTLKYGPIYSSK